MDDDGRAGPGLEGIEEGRGPDVPGVNQPSDGAGRGEPVGVRDLGAAGLA